MRFKYLPYGYKQYSHIEAMDFNSCKISVSGVEYYGWSNKNAYNRIQQNPTLAKQDGNFFSFIHVEGTHPPYDMDKNLSAIQGTPPETYPKKVAASLTVIKAYLQRLKANNAYDNSANVIMADHGGFHGKYGDYSLNTDAFKVMMNSVLFIKGINEKHGMITSDQPVSYVDLQDAFSNLLDGKKSTELFAGLELGRKRTFILQHWESTQPMYEYTTTGKAWEIEKFTPTVNVYTLKK